MPPYNDYYYDFADASVGATTCFNHDTVLERQFEFDNARIPAIFKCFTGIVPYSCPNITNDAMLGVFRGQVSETVPVYGTKVWSEMKTTVMSESFVGGFVYVSIIFSMIFGLL